MVSVIIPTFNRASTIKRSIDSILKQTYQDFEIIIVDDKSTDNTEEIVMSIKDSRVRYIKHEKNLGANSARNTGVRNSNGNIVAFQDSDDEWLPNKLEIQMEAMQKTGADIISCGINKYIGDDLLVIPNYEIDSKSIKDELLYGNFISGQTILGKKDCFLENEFDKSLPRLQEWELMIRLSRKYYIYFVNQPLVNVYVQLDSISNSPEKAVKALNLIKEKHKSIIFNNPKAVVTIYKMLGKYSMEMNEYKENYYYRALKYEKRDLKLYIRSILFEVKRLLN